MLEQKQNMREEGTVTIGVLALQGAFEEHEKCLRAIGCSTVQVRTPQDLDGLDGIVLPGGESTAMGLIGMATKSSSLSSICCRSNTSSTITMWDALMEFSCVHHKPTWGTCAGMILLAEKCIGTSAVIQDGQALIGGMNMTVCRNYFGSQVSSFEMAVPPPPPPLPSDDSTNHRPFNGVFIRAPAILSTHDPRIEILGKVMAVPCRQAAATLAELDRKIANGENVIQLHVMMDRTLEQETSGVKQHKVRMEPNNTATADGLNTITLPGAAAGSTAREVICAARRDNLLCTAFHPELTNDYRWHAYFVNMVKQAKVSK